MIADHGADPSRIEDLVRAARDGDAGARDQLVRATWSGTWTLALRLTRNEQDAADVVQETYLRAHRALPGFRGDARYTTWMYRITANCASSALQKRHRTRTELLPDELDRPDRTPGADPEAQALGGAERAAIDAALAELPRRLRQVVILRDVYDLPHAAIAERLGISEAAAKVRLHRARMRLRRLLDDDAR